MTSLTQFSAKPCKILAEVPGLTYYNAIPNRAVPQHGSLPKLSAGQEALAAMYGYYTGQD